MIKFKAIPFDLGTEDAESFEKAVEIFNQTQKEVAPEICTSR